MILRPYQQAAHDAAIDWVRQSKEPCLIDAATGAGKSLIVSALAKSLNQISKGKRILCLQPSKELLEQNYEKFIRTGDQASLFSASVGKTCLRHPVVFGTPMSVKNKIRRFGAEFCAVIIDEAHGISPTIRHIVDELRGRNPNLRVIGMTATPFRLGSGYIYRIDERGRHLPEDRARDPYFKTLAYRIGARELIRQGFLTLPVVGEIGAENYQTMGMTLNSRGQFSAADVDRAYHGHGRKTAHIVADVVTRSAGRQGVIFFAATVRHAQEVLASLPPELSAIVTGETPAGERASILTRFKRRELKYIVNVSVLTVGFDAPHVDVIAMLRATESVGLLQQIIGRGLRLADGKTDCMILDYAQNIERHCPDGDIFAPDVRARGADKKSDYDIDALCPECSTINVFSARPNEDGFRVDENGYFIDLAGERIQTEHGFMPAHYGRRCLGETRYGQCAYRWTFKTCPHCGGENDIAARFCGECKGELIDPNEKLKMDFVAHKKDPTQVQTDEIISYQTRETMSQSGNECLRVDIVTPYRSFSVWAVKNAKSMKQQRDYDRLSTLEEPPFSVTYRKEESGFYRIYGFNDAIEELPE